MQVPKTGFLPEVHAFRGVAILCVVCAHIGPVERWHVSTEGFQTLSHILWHDSTLFFSLVSGLLFSIVLSTRGWGPFFYGRLRNVGAPYAIATLIATATTIPIDDSGGFPEQVFRNFVFGTAQFSYWYMPILSALYALTPLTWWLAKHHPRYLIVVCALPLVFARTGITVSAKSVVYFWGAYAVGIYVGLDYERSLETIRRRWPTLLAVVVLSSAALIAYPTIRQEAPRFAPIFVEESLFYIQKLAAAALILFALRVHLNRPPRWLAMCSVAAFTIYFYHILAYDLLYHPVLWLQPSTPTTLVWLFFANANMAGAVAICIGLAILARRLFGNSARVLVGA